MKRLLFSLLLLAGCKEPTQTAYWFKLSGSGVLKNANTLILINQKDPHLAFKDGRVYLSDFKGAPILFNGDISIVEMVGNGQRQEIDWEEKE